MKAVKFLGIAVLAGTVGVLAATNPGPAAYDAYASQQAALYLNEELCSEIPGALANLVPGRCAEMIVALQPQIQSLIRDRTQRLNFGILSIYRTAFQVPGFALIPSYQVETLGIFGRFFIYKAAEQ
jgi:hypothetical protein